MAYDPHPPPWFVGKNYDQHEPGYYIYDSAGHIVIADTEGTLTLATRDLIVKLRNEAAQRPFLAPNDGR